MSSEQNPFKISATQHIDRSSKDDTIDLKQIFSIVVRNWIFYTLSIVVCLILAGVFISYSPSGWRVSSKILVDDQKNSPTSAIAGTLTGDISSLLNVKSSADNEIQILKSRSLMASVVKQMQLNIGVYKRVGLKTVELFDDVPFAVGIRYKADTLKKATYAVKVVDGNSFQLTNSEEAVDLKAKFGDTVKLKQYNIVLKPLPQLNKEGEYSLMIRAEDLVVDNFMKDFTAIMSDKQSTTIDLSFNYPNSKKAEAILNTLMQLYLTSNLENKKLIADNTMSFIDSRISIVESELSGVEKEFEQFKEKNDIANISEQSKALVGSASDYYKKLQEQEVQLTVIRDLEKYITIKKLVPSSLLVPEAMAFGQAVNAYNDLIISRDRATLSYTADNPVIKNLDQQVESARTSLLGNVESYKRSLIAGTKQLQKQNQAFTGQLRQVPAKERKYLDFARQQNLKQELYLYLLQKREEAAISKTSTISSSRIIDYAKSEFLPYKPVKAIIFAIGFILGAIIPSLFLYFRWLLNVRIGSKADIEAGTTATIIGEIGHNSNKQSLVTGTNSRSVISEQFRSLRTNLQFIIDSSKSNVLLFTSSMSGEGKSFLSLNLGSALALTGKKIVFLEMDLRKPKLSESFGLSIENGFTNYAISDGANFDYKKILKPLGFNPNCYLISSGPIPPNPAELLIGPKLDTLIAYLKNEFDYIIIDCAPVGLVTDALMINRQADLLLYVIRHGYTYKSQLAIINDLMHNKKVDNVYLVANDIVAKEGYTSYSQAYGYGLEEENFWSKLKFWK